jgi:hypothetical protein
VASKQTGQRRLRSAATSRYASIGSASSEMPSDNPAAFWAIGISGARMPKYGSPRAEVRVIRLTHRAAKTKQ